MEFGLKHIKTLTENYIGSLERFTKGLQSDLGHKIVGTQSVPCAIVATNNKNPRINMLMGANKDFFFVFVKIY